MIPKTRSIRFDISNAAAAFGPDASDGRSFIALLAAFRATGGTAPGEITARLLNERRAGQATDMATLLETGQLFGFTWRSRLWVPMFQFEAADLALKARVQEVRAALPSTGDGWTVATWFATPTVRLDDCCPADMLDADFGAVLRAARSQSSVDRSAAAGSWSRSMDEPHVDVAQPWLHRGLPTAPRAPRLERSRFHDLPR